MPRERAANILRELNPAGTRERRLTQQGTVKKSFGWKLKGQIIGLRSLLCVKENAGCPRLGRIDHGTKNGTLAACTVTSDKKAKVLLISAHFLYHRQGEVRKNFTGVQFLILRTCLLQL